MMRLIALILVALLPFSAQAQENIVAELSQTHVSITTDFTGSEILIFGAVKRDVPRVSLDPLDVIITISGPDAPVTVRKKDRWGPIWINRSEMKIAEAPAFYAVLSTKPVDQILSSDEDLRHAITKAHVIRKAKSQMSEDEAAEFTQALIRIRQNAGTYQQDPTAVNLIEETLFRASVSLPANLVEGAYVTDMYLVRNKEVVSKYTTALDVSKVGLERFLYNLAHDNPFIYGFMSLFIAIAAGWLASAAFRFIKF